jgi:hypothetical protein
MTFRSPPPHRRMSRQTKRKGEFERDQDALQRLVNKVGFDALPVNDDTLRPFLAFLWGFGEARGYKVFTFDEPRLHPDRLYHGLMGSASPLKSLADDMAEALKKGPLWPDIGRAKPVFKVGRISVCYFEGVWTPKAALASRRH